MRSAAYDGEALGSPIRLAVRGSSAPEEAWSAVRDELAAVDAALSGHRRDSALARLNARAGSLSAIPRRLRIALALAWRAHRRTDGLFDPRRTAREPGGQAAAAWLLRRGHTAAVTEPVDLDGIGKGLALRWCAARLAALGESDFLLLAGGDLVAAGSATPSVPWRVTLPGTDPAIPVAVLDLPSTPFALATSAVTRLPDHIVDPRRGSPVRGPLVQVTIAGPDPAWAEVSTKVALIRGAADPEGTAWWVTVAGRLGSTAAASSHTRWARAEPATRSG